MSIRRQLDGWIGRFPSLPYIAPFLLFLVLTTLQASLPGGIGLGYPLKTVVVGAVLFALRPWLPKMENRALGTAIAVGVFVWVIWILPEGLYPLLGESEPFDPFAHFTGGGAFVWIGFRLLGATVVVAITEELFWRGFLIRWIIKPDFRSVAIGTFTWPSFLLTSILFATEHNRWLVGLIAGIIYNILLYRTKSLRACMVAHGMTNLALGLYVLATQQWTFW
jgi:CAAX prenyl protease-like protein